MICYVFGFCNDCNVHTVWRMTLLKSFQSSPGVARTTSALLAYVTVNLTSTGGRAWALSHTAQRLVNVLHGGAGGSVCCCCCYYWGFSLSAGEWTIKDLITIASGKQITAIPCYEIPVCNIVYRAGTTFRHMYMGLDTLSTFCSLSDCNTRQKDHFLHSSCIVLYSEIQWEIGEFCAALRKETLTYGCCISRVYCAWQWYYLLLVFH